jgi:peptidoglycan/LPS O-acetylase OafA/YrhL
VRFFAVTWVLAYDLWPSLGVATPALAARGYLGVELFFVLSGFILCHVYLPSFGEGRFHYGGFLWTRLARIYPVHLVTLAAMGVMTAAAMLLGLPVSGKAVVWPSLPAHLLLIHAWGLAPLGGWNHPSWSISAEWFAYLLFPLFAWTTWRMRRRAGLALALALAGGVAINLGFERFARFPLTQATIAWGALRIVPCFALGCASYLAWRARPLTRPRHAPAALAGVTAGALTAASIGAPDWLMIDLFGGLLFVMASLASTGSSLLTAPLLVYLGELSYAIYMVFAPWRLSFERSAGRLFGDAGPVLPWPLWAAEFIGVIPAAMLVHHLVERPARAAMRRFGERWIGDATRNARPAAGEATTTPL